VQVEGKSGEPPWLYKVGAIKIVVKVRRISAQFMLIEFGPGLVEDALRLSRRACSWKMEPRSRLDEKTRAMPQAGDRALRSSPSLFRAAKSIRGPVSMRDTTLSLQFVPLDRCNCTPFFSNSL